MLGWIETNKKGEHMIAIVQTDYRTRIKRIITDSATLYAVELLDSAGDWQQTKTSVYLSTAKHYARLQASGLYQSDQEARRQSEAAQAKYQRENPNG